MWQAKVLFEHKVIRKVLSLNKKNRLKCKIVWQKYENMNPNFQLHDVPWLFSSYIGIFIIIIFSCSLFIVIYMFLE